MDKYVDLHVHTNFSDGTFSPKEVVEYAKKVGLSAIAITDHDTVDGVASADDEGKKLGIEIIPGVELSCEVQTAEKSEMHILGYFVDWKSENFKEALNKFRAARQERANKMTKKLEEQGVLIKKEILDKMGGEKSIGRLHFAKAIVESGFAKNIQEVFRKYLNPDRPAYVPKFKLSPEDAIKLIKSAGGIAVWAHPYYVHYSNSGLIENLARAGLGGIEVWHSRHSASAARTFKQIADKFDLVATGGSDCHGPYGQDSALMGTVKVPYSVIEELRKRLATPGVEG